MRQDRVTCHITSPSEGDALLSNVTKFGLLAIESRGGARFALGLLINEVRLPQHCGRCGEVDVKDQSANRR